VSRGTRAGIPAQRPAAVDVLQQACDDWSCRDQAGLTLDRALPLLLRGYRQQHGLTLQAAAARLGLGRTVWRTWEACGVVPSPGNLDRLAALLGISGTAARRLAGPDRARRVHDCPCGRAHGLTALRTAAGLTSRALAARVHVSPSTVTRWELGERPCSDADRRRLAVALDLSSESVDQALGPLPLTSLVPTPGLLAARLQSGLTLQQVADPVDVDPTTVRRWERSGRAPAGSIDRLLDRLGTDVLRPQPAPRPPDPVRRNGLAAMRRRAGLSARAIAELLEVSQSTVFAWERGARRPRWPSLRALAKAYRQPAAAVFAAAGQAAPQHLRSGPWPDNALPQVLPEMRRWYGCTQGQLADVLGVSASAVIAWERGRNAPGRRARRALDALALSS